ncbi:MAG: type II toxin-antitoxin system VapC family toxin [Nocardioidaceae bacterium]
MSDCVLDASALVLAVNGKNKAADDLRASLRGAWAHAPHLIDAEVGNVLGRHEHSGLIGEEEAHVALSAAQTLVAYRYPHAGPLAETAWRLRHNLSFYDALYVALAAQVSAPLLTCDARLRKAPGLPCQVELVG